MNDFTTDQLRAINFALTFTYWLNKQGTYRLPEANQKELLKQIYMEIENRAAVE